ncbi:response regulator [Pseudonocardia sp. KRD291]|uniref:response regulator n=1 Tax=Pseudonocardia sp. KRD291 TaxID=2792007 RepID=UPI001C4A74C5|nr:response regulator [Pseudonocardia sp. KRD291]MBW0101654.1 response regulator [Pseudonocardia sp. KRD291]
MTEANSGATDRPDEDRTQSFGGTAVKLAGNPLGIIALFIVLVYGVAALITAFASRLAPYERLPLVIFLVAFPVLVLGSFLWLVTRYPQSLYAPKDFVNEDNWVRVQLETAVSLAAAKKSDPAGSEVNVASVVDAVQRAAEPSQRHRGETTRREHILWVDDNPQNNTYERKAFEAQGCMISLAMSTEEALAKLAQSTYAAIISDMGRAEGAREGYVLLDEMRRRGISTPFFVYSSSGALEHRREASAHGGDGATNRADELFTMVLSAIR